MANITAEEALKHHQNLVFRRCLEKLQAEQPLTEEELAEVQRREAEEKKQQKKAEPKPLGKKSKLTHQLIKKICSIVAKGNTYKTACLMVRIAPQTFSKWMHTTEKVTPIMRELREAVKVAEAEAEEKMVEVITKSARENNWTAAAWYLERKNPEVWGRKDKIQAEHSGPQGGPIQVEQQVVFYIPDNGRRTS